MKSSTRYSWAMLWSLIALFVVANAFAIWYVGQERIIYSHDSIGYWIKFVEWSGLLVSHPFSAVVALMVSIRDTSYSYLSILPIVPAYFVLGVSRTAYILGIVNMLAVPAILSFVLVQKKAADATGPKSSKKGRGIFQFSAADALPLGVAALTVLTSAAFWGPIVYGMVDVGGIVVINLIFLCLFTPFHRQTMRQIAVLGCLLVLLLLFRRWYSIWVVSFFLAAAVQTSFMLLEWRLAFRDRFRQFLLAIGKLLMVGCIVVALLFILAKPIIMTMMTSNYADMYSAFQIGNPTLSRKIEYFSHYFGTFHMLAFVLGFFYSLFVKEVRRVAILMMLILATSFYLFTRVQYFNMHHYFLVLPAMIFYTCFFVADILRRIRSSLARGLIVSAYAVVCLFIFSAVFFSSISSLQQALAAYVPGTLYPRVRNDLKEMERLRDALVADMASPDDRVYVLAESTLLVNPPILKYMHYTLGGDAELEDKVLDTQVIDKRDGFPFNLFKANYVVVTDPIQSGVRFEESQILVLPATMMLSGEGIGRSFQRLPETFTLDRGVKAFIYKRVQPFFKSDVQAFSDVLREKYPDRLAIYRVNFSQIPSLAE